MKKNKIITYKFTWKTPYEEKPWIKEKKIYYVENWYKIGEK